MPLHNPATVGPTDLETIRDKVSLKVSICANEVDVDVGELVFRPSSISHQNYADCVLDDGDLAKELSDYIFCEDHLAR